MNTVFVTGATGRLGRAICRELISAGYTVRALARSTPVIDIDADWIRGDILDPQSYIPALRGCCAVIHLAAELSDQMRMDRTNVEATLDLLENSGKAGIRYFCFASSVSVYGSPSTPAVTEETPIIDPEKSLASQYFNRPYVRDYARTKAAAELAIARLVPDMSVDIVRPSVVRDASELLEIGGMGKMAQIFMAPRKSQYVLTSDLAAAVRHLMVKGLERPAKVDIFNIADEDNPTYAEIMALGRKKTGDPRFYPIIHAPPALDILKYRLTYRRLNVGIPLGYLDISNRKLRGTGFEFPTGIRRALRGATAD